MYRPASGVYGVIPNHFYRTIRLLISPITYDRLHNSLEILVGNKLENDFSLVPTFRVSSCKGGRFEIKGEIRNKYMSLEEFWRSFRKPNQWAPTKISLLFGAKGKKGRYSMSWPMKSALFFFVFASVTLAIYYPSLSLFILFFKT